MITHALNLNLKENINYTERKMKLREINKNDNQ